MLIPTCANTQTLVAMFRPQRVGRNTIFDLYLLISTGSALQNVKELHGIFILVKRVAHLHFAPTHQQTSTPALSYNDFVTPKTLKQKKNKETKKSRLTAASLCFLIKFSFLYVQQQME